MWWYMSPITMAVAFLTMVDDLLMISAAMLIVVPVALMVLIYYRGGGARARREPPGCLGLPVLGETLRLVAAYKTEHPEPFMDERIGRYGRIFTTHVFGEKTVFSADPEFNRMVLMGEGRSFERSYPASISNLLGANSILLVEGALHKRLHTFALNRFSSPAAIRRSLLPHIDRIVRRVLDSWEPLIMDGDDRRHHNHTYSSPPMKITPTLRLLEQTKKITFDLTMQHLMGYDPCEWTEGLRRQYLLVIDGFFSLALPLPSFLASFTTYGRAIQARKKVAEALRSVVKERKEEMKWRRSDHRTIIHSEGVERSDVLGELLEGEAGDLSEEELVDMILALLVAGYETTSTAMALAVKFVSETPSALLLLTQEQDGVAAKKRDAAEPLDWSDYKSMPFTQCVINETLRVANIIGGVFRRTLTDVHYKGYTIPKGCRVFPCFRGVHMDPEYYDDARSFNPWRWQQSPESPQLAGGVFTPFGGGARLCPGSELSRVHISVFLHYLVTRYSWNSAEDDRLLFFPTTRLLKGYPIILRRRGTRGRRCEREI